MTGHSLGGTVVQHVAMKNPYKVTYATAFNPGSNPILHREEDELVGQHTNIRTVIQKLGLILLMSKAFSFYLRPFKGYLFML